jgi:shikimate dehydrogenase
MKMSKPGKMPSKKSKHSPRLEEDGNPVSSQLDQHRKKIDQLDQQLLDLINRRLAVAKEIGKVKDRKNTDVVDTQRETEIFRKLLELNQGLLLPRKSLYQIVTAIISASREIQQPGIQKASERNAPALYAVIGNPVSHSLSPVMHNSAFSAIGFNGMYFPLELDDIQLAMSGLKSLNIKGASITIPHKTAVIDFLDNLDDGAARIKAVNTIVNIDGRLVGYNTDCTGAMRALSGKTEINDKDVAIIGAGGAARAIGFGIKNEGGRITILNRSTQKGEQLSKELDAGFVPLSEVKKLNCEILINTTAVGMTPHVDEMCLPKAVLEKGMVVMDIVYTPLKTKLLQEAEKRGCPCIDGLSMFVYQGAEQFTLWTGQKAPVDIMRLAVLAGLEE